MLSTKQQCLTGWWVRGQIASLPHGEGMKTSCSDNEDFDAKSGCSPIWFSTAATHLGEVSRKDQMKIKHFGVCKTQVEGP